MVVSLLYEVVTPRLYERARIRAAGPTTQVVPSEVTLLSGDLLGRIMAALDTTPGAAS